jgi:hypothetical protein
LSQVAVAEVPNMVAVAGLVATDVQSLENHLVAELLPSKG